MAHECPDCGQVCHCNGDIDDIDFGEDPNCTCCCCKVCGGDEFTCICDAEVK